MKILDYFTTNKLTISRYLIGISFSALIIWTVFSIAKNEYSISNEEIQSKLDTLLQQHTFIYQQCGGKTD